MKAQFIVVLFSFLFALSSNAQSEKSVYIFVAEECPVTIYMTQDLRKTSDLYDEEFKYYAVFPKKNSSKESAEKFLNDYQLKNFSIILDPRQKLASDLGAKVTPEAVILDNNNDILYRGRINDAYFAPGRKKHRADKHELREALATIKDDKKIPQKDWETAIGCFITFHKSHDQEVSE